MRTHATHIRASIIVNHVACVTKIYSMNLCGDLAIFSAFVLFLDCLISRHQNAITFAAAPHQTHYVAIICSGQIFLFK